MDDEQAHLLVGLARSLWMISNQSWVQNEAFDMLEIAFEYFVEQGDVEGAVTAAERHVVKMEENGTSHHLVNRAMGLVEPGSLLEGRLRHRLNFAEYFRIRESSRAWSLEEKLVVGLQEQIEEERRILRVAERHHDLELQRRSRFHLCMFSWLSERWEECLREADLALTQEGKMDDPAGRVACHSWCLDACAALGRTAAAREHASALLSRDPGLLHVQVVIVVRSALLFMLLGEFERASEILDQFGSINDPRWGAYILLIRAEIEVQKGNLEEVVRLLDQIARSPVPDGIPPAAMLSTALTAASPRHIEQSKERLLTFMAHASFEEARELFPALCSLALSEMDIPAIRRYYKLLKSLPRHFMERVDSNHMLGLLAQTAGMMNEASSHYAECIAFSREAGYLPELASTCHDYAVMLLDRGSPDDLGKARALLEEAVLITEKLGMKMLLEKIREAEARLDERAAGEPASHAPGRTHAPDGLTEREVEVLKLVAKGFNNAEVAEFLNISRRTVSTHLSHVYEKTGTANRTEATAYAVRQGLADE